MTDKKQVLQQTRMPQLKQNKGRDDVTDEIIFQISHCQFMFTFNTCIAKENNI